MNELTEYTDLEEDICLRVVDAVQKKCGEIGNILIEDNDISFEVYRGYFEDPPKVIGNDRFTLRLIDKFDDPFFTLVYRIKTIRQPVKQLRQKKSRSKAKRV